jgi:hypothetical protein
LAYTLKGEIAVNIHKEQSRVDQRGIANTVETSETREVGT